MDDQVTEWKEEYSPLADIERASGIMLDGLGIKPRTPAEEHRVKIVSLPEHFLIDVLNYWRDPPNFLALPISDALPVDCVVVGVAANFECRCLDVMVASKEFPIARAGCCVERIPGVLEELRTVSFSDIVARHKRQDG